MSNKPLTIFLVLSKVDCGDEVVSAHFTKSGAEVHMINLQDGFRYDDPYKLQFRVLETIID